MAVMNGKTRLNITLPDDCVAWIDGEVKRTGGTRSAVIAAAVLEVAEMRDAHQVTPEQMIRIMQGVIAKRNE